MEGITGKLAEGSFAILNPTAYGYLDKYGNLDPHPWIVKFPDKPYDWPYGKVDLSTIPVGRASTDGMEAEGEGGLLDSITGTIAWAKTLTGSLTQTLPGKVVTAGNDQFSGCIYIEEPDGSCGIKVVPTPGSWHFGDTVNVKAGTMDEDANGERYIASAIVEEAGAVDIPDPVFMIQRSLGGSELGEQRAVKDGHGLSNIGLLVRAVGKVTASESTCFYIDDGSAMNDGLEDPEVLGVRVETDHLIGAFPIPPEGAYVIVTSISSCRLDDSDPPVAVRVLRPRSPQDLRAATVIHVKPGGDNDKDGLTWDNAVATVQKGIDLAHDAGVGEVWVAEGTYRDLINVKSHVALYGGFAVGETYREQRSWTANETILDGDPHEPDWTSGTVVTISNISSCSIDGFTIENGDGAERNLTGHPDSWCGGGIYCYGGSSITISHNKIIHNSVIAIGGGICCTASSPEIANNVIQDNVASNGEGGGLFCNDGACPVIKGNRFIHNFGATHGGAIALEGEATNPLIVNNLFLNNELEGETYGGGAISQKQGSCRIINNTFAGNNAASGCGGAVTLAASSKLYNNIFYNNIALRGGLSVYSSAEQDIQFCDAFSEEAEENDADTHFGGINPLDLHDCLYADPLFADIMVDYRLALTPTPSPCIDKGANPGSAPYDDVPNVDIEDNPRPVDIPDVGNDEGNAYSDMGAYEAQPQE